MGTSKNSGQILLAGFIGATIGTAIAVLYAPESGKKTRTRLQLEAELAVARLESAVEELTGNLEQSVSETNDDIGYLIGSAAAKTSYTTNELIHLLEGKLKKLKSRSKRKDAKKVNVKNK